MQKCVNMVDIKTMLQSESLVANIGFDTAENRLPKDTNISPTLSPPQPPSTKVALSFQLGEANQAACGRSKTFRFGFHHRTFTVCVADVRMHGIRFHAIRFACEARMVMSRPFHAKTTSIILQRRFYQSSEILKENVHPKPCNIFTRNTGYCMCLVFCFLPWRGTQFDTEYMHMSPG